MPTRTPSLTLLILVLMGCLASGTLESTPSAILFLILISSATPGRTPDRDRCLQLSCCWMQRRISGRAPSLILLIPVLMDCLAFGTLASTLYCILLIIFLVLLSGIHTGESAIVHIKLRGRNESLESNSKVGMSKISCCLPILS